MIQTALETIRDNFALRLALIALAIGYVPFYFLSMVHTQLTAAQGS